MSQWITVGVTILAFLVGTLFIGRMINRFSHPRRGLRWSDNVPIQPRRIGDGANGDRGL